MYQPYLTYQEYVEAGNDTLDSETASKFLTKASRVIDALTYNRILKYGFDSLSDFQKEIIKDVTAKIADFNFVNNDALSSILTSYNINGVSMSFGKDGINITMQNGNAVPSDAFSELEQTGLTTGSFRI